MSIALLPEEQQDANQAVVTEEDATKEDTEKCEDSDEDDDNDNDDANEDESEEDDGDDEDIERKLHEQLLEDIRRARAQSAVQRSPKEEAALTTIKTVLAFATSDSLVHETLAATPVPGHPGSNVLGMLNEILEEGRISPQVAGPLSHVLVKLAKSELLFSPLPSLSSQTPKRKRDSGEETDEPTTKRSILEESPPHEQLPDAPDTVVNAGIVSDRPPCVLFSHTEGIRVEKGHSVQSCTCKTSFAEQKCYVCASCSLFASPVSSRWQSTVLWAKGVMLPPTDLAVMAEPDSQASRPEWSKSLPPLPDELWEKIFLYLLPKNPSFSPHEHPTLLTHVCRTWRRVAISYTLLWSRISLRSYYDNISLGTVEFFELWLERSKSTPLDVDLRLPFDILPWAVASDDKEFDVINKILSLLHKHASHLRTLLRGYPQFLNLVLQFEDLPLLELFLVDPPVGELCTFPIVSLPSSLKCFATFNTYIHFTSATRWPRLEHLELWQTDAGFAGLSPGDCLDILSQLPSLCSAGLHISISDDEGRSNPSRVVLPSLRCLVISTFPEHDIGVLLRALSTPVLEAVGLDGCSVRVLADSLPNFLTQCSRTLRFTALGQIGMISVTLLGALSECPPLSRIAICSSSFDGHVAARVGRARRTERGVEYADRWTSKGSPGHMLCLSYTSEEMWSDITGKEATFSFPEWTYQDLDHWRAVGIFPDLAREAEDRETSVNFSICMGQSASHCTVEDCWLS